MVAPATSPDEDTMKAFALTAADQPAALVDIPDPEAPAGGVLIRTRAASINGFDLFEANGYLVSMMAHDFPVVIGRDMAGVVEAVGPGKTDFAVGDDVMGFVPTTPPLHVGTWAELVPAGPDVVLALIPAGLSVDVAAALPLAGTAALDAVEAGDVAAGDVVLIVGATGGVGSIALQLAAERGATVIATAREGDDDAFVRSLGATETIDYSAVDVAETIRTRYPGGIDVLLDFVDRDAAFAAVASVVRAGGRIATTMGAADVEALAARGTHATNVMAAPTPEKLADLASRVTSGTLRVEIQRTYGLDEAAAAFSGFTAGTRGKLVMRIG
jgi:NADPH:quinone reductase-like Zn-dependent oxidoreductase